jgi:phosphate transport system substrate-binding protein
VGGPDLPIVPVSQDINATGSTLGLLLRDLPGDRQTLAEKIHPVRDTTAAVRKVANTPGAIGFGTQALIVNQQSIRPIGIAKGQSSNYFYPLNANGQINKTALQAGTYPLIQRIFVILRQDGTLDETAGVAYANLLLSEKGQALIGQAGYLPLRFQ